MVVIGGDQPRRAASEVEQERLVNQFPNWAVTRAGAASGGYDQDVPPSPAYPAAAPTASTAATPAAPAAPQVPAAPINKLWPRDTVPIFMQSCVGYRPKLFVPCQCIIGRLMLEMPHDEFLALTAKGTIEDDNRLKTIRQQCAGSSGLPPKE